MDDCKALLALAIIYIYRMIRLIFHLILIICPYEEKSLILFVLR